MSFLFSLCVLSGFFLPFGCDQRDAPRVVLYTSIDEPIARPIIQRFEDQTGIRVTLVTDSEASKTVGLAERLRAERSNPQADVYWGNEQFHTINLAQEGVLAAYQSPSAGDIPTNFKDPEHLWAGNALRARVIAEDEIVSPTTAAIGLESLLDPRYRDKVAIARPTAGTTGGHVAALYVLWGEQRADEYFRRLRDNGVKMLGGNAVVTQQVAARTIHVGLTDNDDVAAARDGGGVMEMTLPDQHSFGTLLVPTTVGLVLGARNPQPARQLIDYLLSAEVEQALIDARFAGWSVRRSHEVKAMDVDYRDVARIMPQAVRRATAILEGRE